jgi:glyoxylase-like metal-dependent hydrolase (beta-lactamase superfamily II)
VPSMPGWRWLHTPGHSAGHVSLWRESDRALVAGDAFITTDQESAYSVAVQKPEMHGPPMYFTPDWASARASVEKLVALGPEVVITGHGRPMAGESMRSALHTLARDFDQVAVPKHGRYAGRPATAADGSAYREP